MIKYGIYYDYYQQTGADTLVELSAETLDDARSMADMDWLHLTEREIANIKYCALVSAPLDPDGVFDLDNMDVVQVYKDTPETITLYRYDYFRPYVNKWSHSWHTTSHDIPDRDLTGKREYYLPSDTSIEYDPRYSEYRFQIRKSCLYKVATDYTNRHKPFLCPVFVEDPIGEIDPSDRLYLDPAGKYETI